MPSLWTPTDWPQRLAELQTSTGELKEAPLRRDVRSLGMLLGEVLREQAGDPLYDAVEALRRTAIAIPTNPAANSAIVPGSGTLEDKSNPITSITATSAAFSACA